MSAYTHTRNGLTHACDGTVLEDGTSTAWRLCDGAHVAALVLAGDEPITCPRCHKLEDSARILGRPTLALGPPDLIASSWPGPRRFGALAQPR